MFYCHSCILVLLKIDVILVMTLGQKLDVTIWLRDKVRDWILFLE